MGGGSSSSMWLSRRSGFLRAEREGAGRRLAIHIDGVILAEIQGAVSGAVGVAGDGLDEEPLPVGIPDDPVADDARHGAAGVVERGAEAVALGGLDRHL